MQLTLTPGEIVGIVGLFLLVYRLIQSRLDKVQAENEAAHAGIVKRIDDVDRRAEERSNQVERRTDERFDAFERRTNERFDAFERRTEERFNQVERRTEERLNEVERRTEERFNEVERRAEERFNAVEQRAEERSNAHRAVLDAIARDVAFLAGRQEERDRQAPPDTSL